MTALLVSLFVLVTVVAIIAVVPPGRSSATLTPHRAAEPRKTEELPPPSGADCPNRLLPPAPVDTSEEPPPGVPSPEPLPVPEEPVGGTRMGECGVIQPDSVTRKPPRGITAASWIVADLESGEVLAAKNPHARERPASLIKVLLSIVVLRELRPDQVVVGTQADANQEGTRVGVGPGGRYTVDQLFHALVMRSGNDVAHALARELGGVKATLRKMNAVAKELGALDTRAATPSGLDGPGMTTSAYDQALIFREAMQYPEFADAIATSQIDFPGFRNKPGFVVSNDNALLGTYRGFLGGKTGFTDDAQHTYVGAAKRGEHTIVTVLLRGKRNPGPLADQGAKLLNYGFSLARKDVRPVGQLVDASPEAQPKQNSGTASGNAGDAASGPNDKSMSAFGTVGLPLVLLAGVAVLISALMWLRRRRARVARQRL